MRDQARAKVRSWAFGHKNAINPTRCSNGKESWGKWIIAKVAWEPEALTTS